MSLMHILMVDRNVHCSQLHFPLLFHLTFRQVFLGFCMSRMSILMYLFIYYLLNFALLLPIAIKCKLTYALYMISLYMYDTQ